MNQRILYCAIPLAIATSGCSGSTDGQSESGQGGTQADRGGGSSSVSSAAPHNGGAAPHSGGAATTIAANGGQSRGGNTNLTTAGTSTPMGGASGVLNNGGSSAVGSAVAGGTSGGLLTGGTTHVATSRAGSGGSATGGRNSGGRNSGGVPSSTSSTGGVATGGKNTTAVAGGSMGGKGVGGSSTSATTSSSTGAAGAAGSHQQIALPEANASFDYQIGGAYSPPSGVRVVSRDRNSAPAAGLYNICYVNGYQIQPDEESLWSSQHPNLILKDGSGNPVVDEDWGETLLDTSTSAKRDELATVIGGWITKCKTDGFDAVEIDNLDSYSRSGGLLTQANNVAFMALLSSVAHANGMAIAQKNSSELLGSAAAMGTDFAVVEECNRWDECDQYQAVYGNRIFIIEYRSQDFQKGCSAYPELSIVLRDVGVSAPGSSEYVYQGC